MEFVFRATQLCPHNYPRKTHAHLRGHQDTGTPRFLAALPQGVTPGGVVGGTGALPKDSLQ